MENSNRMKELQQKLQYYKTLIKDYEKTKQELNAIAMDKPKFSPPTQKQNVLDVSRKWQTQQTYNYSNVSKFNSKYVLNRTKGISSQPNIPFQNNASVQYKNAKTTLINKINSPKNSFRVQYKNSKTTLINKINFPKNNLQVRVQFKNPKTLINKISSPKNELRVQFKNPKTTLINKVSAPKNELGVQFKNPQATPLNKIISPKNALCSAPAQPLIHERNLGLKLNILSPKCTTEPFAKNSDNPTETTKKVDSVVKVSPGPSKVADVPKMSQTCNIREKTLSLDTNLEKCSSKPLSAYSQILNDIISLTKELKQSTKDSDSCKSLKSSILTKAGSSVGKHLLPEKGKVSDLTISSNLKVVNKFCMAKLRKSNPVGDLKAAKLREIRNLEIKNVSNKAGAGSFVTVSLGSNLHNLPSTSLSKTNDDVKTRRNSNRKIFSSQYKVVNKNSGSHVKLSALKLVKTKAVDSKAMSAEKLRLQKLHLQKIHQISQCSPKLRNVLNTKYKIINKTSRNSISKASIQSGSSKKICNVDKMVNNSSNVQSPSFKLGIKMPNMKACKVVNVTPIFKLTHNVKNKTNVHVSHHKNSIKRPRVLNSKYKVVNKLSTPKQSIFINKSIFQINSQKKSDRVQRFVADRLSHIHRNSTHKPVLLKRLYKSKNKIINKNSSPVTQTAKMIKTKYVALYKQRSLPSHKQFVGPRHKMSKGHHLRPYYSKPRHTKHGYYSAAFYNPHAIRFLSTNRYSKINMKVKKSSLYKRRFTPARYGYRSKFASGYGKTFYKNSKFVAPVSQLLASRVLHRSINQAVIKSTRKNSTKVNTYCMFYNRFGKCNKGIKCSFIHDPSKIAVCTRFLRGTCKSESCPFSHEISPGKMALCTYYLLGSCKNDKCPYRHESLSPNSDLCKEFVQGYCSKGRKCDKAHILICPHYAKGECDKGDKCLFPHPPQKAKKSSPQDVKEVTNANASEEQFLENVSRYFQTFTEESVQSHSSKPSENCQSVLVRRSRLLPEQPSFIPLSQSVGTLDGI
ncbi:uncharacterized protein LOC129229397 [Uloborus diversus]|uniref:uncharacterized protein LOC129229397 n=1 Tax=Uloborus diversus TaxID=327109 RepID=UPI002409819E|nr:uncharacterized protein LOC129229397 [Uloborus diversus]